jgi:glutamate-1-semialdehyde aminotransferase
MLQLGIHLPPAQYEAWFLSAALTDAHIALIREAAAAALAETFR